MKNKKISLFFIFMGILVSCNPSLYIPVSTDSGEQEQLMAGRKLYVDRCSSCHNLHFPAEFSADQWHKNLDEMQVKAKISDQEKQLIFRFLTFQNGKK